ncbi:MAG: XdhC family protein [Vicinamibacterales bacterium]
MSTPGDAGSLYVRMAELVAVGQAFAVATVVRTEGSTPQSIGARMVVTAGESERPVGTLGGGCVEADAILAARAIIGRGERVLHVHQLNEELAWNTGLVCGGTMWILVEDGPAAVSCGGRDILPDAVAATQGGPAVAVVTRLARGDRQTMTFAARAVVLAGGRLIGSVGERSLDERVREAAIEQMRLGTPRVISADESSDVLIEPIVRRPRLIVAGGGHVAKAIAHQARLLDFDVTILEDRPAFADPARFNGAEVLTGHVPDTIASLDYHDQTWLIVATRGHKLDGDCVLAAARTPVRYIGLLGSRRKTILIADMLRDEGVPEDRIAVVRAPVGLDLGGRTPAEIALAILAEITQMRHGGSGAPLARLQ